jgi:antitoxin (DNA-binding transcriptional repressor) of toxin-antitoxin stability system
VPDISATHAARNFADLLDAIEHRQERFTIVRRGRAVAHLEPIGRGRGVDVKAVLRRRPDDRSWAEEVDAIRSLLSVERRP